MTLSVSIIKKMIKKIRNIFPKKYKNGVYRFVWFFLHIYYVIRRKSPDNCFFNRGGNHILTSIISLPHRDDRRELCKDNFNKFDLNYKNVSIVDGVIENNFPALGASKAHLKALSKFYFDSTCDYGIILEDDFCFERSFNEIKKVLKNLNDNNVCWDVIMLTGMSVICKKDKSMDKYGLKRLYSAQSGAGYIVNRVYTPNLINCMSKSVVILSQNKKHCDSKIMLTTTALDKAWNESQKKDNWFIFSSRMGVQRESYSDIEGRTVDYKLSTFGLTK